LYFSSGTRRRATNSTVIPPSGGQTHLTRLLPMPPDYQHDSFSSSSPIITSPNHPFSQSISTMRTHSSTTSDQPVKRPL
jgi:hypothetical protein